MNSSATKSKWLFLALLILCALALSACSGGAPATHEWLEAPGWSRSGLIGGTSSGYPVLPVLDPSGNHYFAVAHLVSNVPSIEVFALDSNLGPLWQTELSLERLNRANRPTLILTTRGLEVFWLMDDALFSAILDTEGAVLSQPARLSGSNDVASYDVTMDASGQRVLWFSGDRANPGVYTADPAGNLTTIDRQGIKPQVQLDADGALHVVWLENPTGEFRFHFYYAYYPGAVFVPDQEQLLWSAQISATSGLLGPELGLEETNAYIFWTEVERTGLSAGQATSHYITFPHNVEEGSAAISSELSLSFPNGYNLVYTDADASPDTALHAGNRALAEDQEAPLVPSPTDIYAKPQQSGELAVAFRARLPYLRHKEASQIGLVFLDNQQETSYQLLSFTPAISELPTILADGDGYLHATWLEESREGDYRLYYATTEPLAKAALDTMTNEDRLRLTGAALFGLLSGVLLIPFPIFWALGAVVFSFITGPLRRESEPFTAPGTLFTIVAGLAIYFAVKLISFPGVITYVPFSAWLPMLPEAWFEPLRIGLPILIAILGFVVAYKRTFARANHAPLFFFLIFALVDGLLTIAVYGVVFYGAI